MKRFINITAGISGPDRISFLCRGIWYTSFMSPSGQIVNVVTPHNPYGYGVQWKATIMAVLIAAHTIIQYVVERWSWMGLTNVTVSILWVFALWLWPTMNRLVTRQHGAEHMVLNAFRCQRPLPTLEEVRVSSRIADECGSALLAPLIVFLPLFGGLAWWTNIPLAMAFAVTLLILGIIARNPKHRLITKVGRLVQHLTTSEPTDQELKLALAALNCAADAVDKKN